MFLNSLLYLPVVNEIHLQFSIYKLPFGLVKITEKVILTHDLVLFTFNGNFGT